MYIHCFWGQDKLPILVGMLFFLIKMHFAIEGHINFLEGF